MSERPPPSYRGRPGPWGRGDRETLVVRPDGSYLHPDPSRALLDYAPRQGFEWGNREPGAAQLALALLLDATGDREGSLRWHRMFLRRHVAKWTRRKWEMPRDRIKAWFDTETGRPCKVTLRPVLPEPGPRPRWEPPPPTLSRRREFRLTPELDDDLQRLARDMLDHNWQTPNVSELLREVLCALLGHPSADHGRTLRRLGAWHDERRGGRHGKGGGG